MGAVTAGQQAGWEIVGECGDSGTVGGLWVPGQWDSRTVKGLWGSAGPAGQLRDCEIEVLDSVTVGVWKCWTAGQSGD